MQLTNQNCETRLRQILQWNYSFVLKIDSAWTREWEWNNIERFAQQDWLEQKLMKKLTGRAFCLPKWF